MFLQLPKIGIHFGVFIGLLLIGSSYSVLGYDIIVLCHKASNVFLLWNFSYCAYYAILGYSESLPLSTWLGVTCIAIGCVPLPRTSLHDYFFYFAQDCELDSLNLGVHCGVLLAAIN